MRGLLVASGLALALSASVPVVAAPSRAPETTQASFEASLHPQSGDISVSDARAVLHLGKDYYFLPADDAKRVLTQVWGNPPDSVSDVLGLILPAGKTAFDNVWGAVVTFEDTGHVSDADAGSQDYAAVLKNAQDGAEASNAARREAGYPAVHLVGWAQPPSYDGTHHALIWARNLAFDGGKVNSLNYDVRTLGRTGALSLNMVSDMNSLPKVRTAAKTLSERVAFVPGATYADYDASIDKTAEYGLAGLVAAGVGAAAVKKLGLLAIILAFGKKFFVLVIAAVAAGGRYLFGRIGKPKDPDLI
ncbi:DUF2167 domain-containing protein [Sphingomonas sp. Leaf33]|uniref:DUF2167 domain-containing protein n=1 Tax=Sphingomonas sp. Leaf33 TaxID=1736215 RepID=UPI000B32D4CA|nr:DUF2167 domain-containing protein [Sphingomonas sp. Leaf33]